MKKDEQITFDGIPIPLTMETLLYCYIYTCNLWKPERARQQTAFRSRILRMFAEKDEQVEYEGLYRQLSEKNAEIRAKDTRIADLETTLKWWGLL